MLLGCQSQWEVYRNIGISELKVHRHMGIINEDGVFEAMDRAAPIDQSQNIGYLRKREKRLQESIQKKMMDIIGYQDQRQVYQIVPLSNCSDPDWQCQESLLTRFEVLDQSLIDDISDLLILDLQFQFYIDNRQRKVKLVEDDPTVRLIESAFWQQQVIETRFATMILKVQIKARQHQNVIFEDEWFFEKDTRNISVKLSELDSFVWVDSKWTEALLMEFYQYLDRELNAREMP